MIARRSFALGGLAGIVLSKTALAETAADLGATQQRADAALVSVVQDWLTESPRTPGVAVAMQFANGDIWNQGFGLADITTKRPMAANEYMRIASVTKTFTGTVLLQLVDEGRIHLDDPLSQYIAGDIPEVPNADQITIRMLGNMSSGIFDYVAIVDPDGPPGGHRFGQPPSLGPRLEGSSKLGFPNRHILRPVRGGPTATPTSSCWA